MQNQHIQACDLDGLALIDLPTSVPGRESLKENVESFHAAILSNQSMIDSDNGLMSNIFVHQRNSVLFMIEKCAACLCQLQYVYRLYSKSGPRVIDIEKVDRACHSNISSVPFGEISDLLQMVALALSLVDV